MPVAGNKKSGDQPLAEFASFGSGSNTRPPVFNLFDPRKRMVFAFDEDHSCLSSSGHPPRRPSLDEPCSSADQWFTNYAALTRKACLATEGERADLSYETIPNSTLLLHRLTALDHALKTLPQQARRLVRILAQREKAPAGIKRIPALRPGIPPGFRDRGKYEVDYVLRECHGLVRDREMAEP